MQPWQDFPFPWQEVPRKDTQRQGSGVRCRLVRYRTGQFCLLSSDQVRARSGRR